VGGKKRRFLQRRKERKRCEGGRGGWGRGKITTYGGVSPRKVKKSLRFENSREHRFNGGKVLSDETRVRESGRKGLISRA